MNSDGGDIKAESERWALRKEVREKEGEKDWERNEREEWERMERIWLRNENNRERVDRRERLRERAEEMNEKVRDDMIEREDDWERGCDDAWDIKWRCIANKQ